MISITEASKIVISCIGFQLAKQTDAWQTIGFKPKRLHTSNSGSEIFAGTVNRA